MSNVDTESVAYASASATSTLVSTGPTRVRGIYVRATASAGTVVLKDGGASGTTKATIRTPAVAGAHSIPVPGGGLSFGTDVHATLTNADDCGVFYASDATVALA